MAKMPMMPPSEPAEAPMSGPPMAGPTPAMPPQGAMPDEGGSPMMDEPPPEQPAHVGGDVHHNPRKHVGHAAPRNGGRHPGHEPGGRNIHPGTFHKRHP